MAVELTTLADDEAVFHEGAAARRYLGLRPGSEHELEGMRVRTLPRPAGELLARVATVNDLHFGETECGRVDGLDVGPVLCSLAGEEPYPEVMNRAAVAEIAAAGVDAVVVKGDITTTGARAEYEAFLRCYGQFGDRLHWVRGNHDAACGDGLGGGGREVVLPGVRLALVDTVVPGQAGGRVGAEQLEWLDELGARADRPVLVLGHHHPWDPGAARRPERYFGIEPADSERLVAVVARRPALVGYFAGHTHRNRRRHFRATGAVPWVEVACVKDFPGAWAEYRVHEGGVLQVGRRISTPEALDWSERTRALFGGLYPGYAAGALEDRCFAIPLRA